MINSSTTEVNSRSHYNTEPLSPWVYLGLMLLFYIPIVGIVLMIVYSFDNSNVNRRNFARSYFCLFLISIFLGIILSVIGASTGFFTMILNRLAM